MTQTTVTKKQKITDIVCIAFLIVGFIYSFALSFSWGNDPFDVNGTLSLLCENRQGFFWLWIFLDGGAMFLNINYMYKKYGGAGKFIKAMPVLAMISAIVIAATLGHSLLDWNPKRVAHWAATVCYIVFLVASMVLYALKNIKNGKIFRILLISVASILLLLVIWFVILGKSGMFEMIPRALFEILLLIVNFVIKDKKYALV